MSGFAEAHPCYRVKAVVASRNHGIPVAFGRIPRSVWGRSARATEIDASYGAYDEHPLDEPDEWGDLASFREAAARS